MQTVLITGANRGIGLELTRRYAAAGDHVFACCREPEQATALQALAKASPNVTVLGVRVSDGASVASLAARIGDAPIDVWIDGGVGKGVTAVRFWIGTQDAKGSIKAKAEIEEGKWHTHVEIPSPIAEGANLWVEIEEAGGKKTQGSFGLMP